ncbi:MAG TPA: hypothetical protein VIN65_04770 [Candidatus Dormibacteraeota bacterium]
MHLFVQPLHPLGGELNTLVELLDLALEHIGGDEPLPTSGWVLAVLHAQAEEVQIATLGELQAEAPAADPADEDALEVMAMAALARALSAANGEHVLHAVEELRWHKRLVQSRRLDAVPRDDPHVELVAQQPLHAGQGDRSSRPVGEAATAQLFKEMLLSELAGGIQLESELHHWRALRIGNDARHTAMSDRLADVAVADRCLLRIAAHLGLLHHALLHFGGKVGRIELSHQRVNAFNQTTGRGLLQLLADRDKSHIATAQRRANGDMVLDVAGQAVDLVDHDRVDVALFDDAPQHGLQLGAVDAAGGLAAVGVLVDQLPTLLADVAQAGLPLCRDGEALLGQVALGLLGGGDAKVDQASHRGSSGGAVDHRGHLNPAGKASRSARTA